MVRANTAAVVVAAVVVAAATGLAGCAASGSAPPHPTLGPTLVTLPVDVVAGTDLRTADGRRISLAWAGSGSQVVRVNAGWLVSRRGEGGTDVWLQMPDGHRVEILRGVGAFVVSMDGGRVAYRRDGDLVVAELPTSGIATPSLRVTARTTGAGRLEPSWLFPELLVLAQSPTGGEPEAFDTWRWSKGGYRPSPLRPFHAGGLAYTARGLSGPPSLVGVESGDCLALFDLETLAVRQRACELPGLAGRPSVSPDGRWLLVRLDSGGSGHERSVVGVVDLHTAFGGSAAAGSPVAGTWSVDPDLFVDIGACAWPDAVTALCAADGGLVRLRVNRPGAAEFVPVGGSSQAPNASVMVVPVPDLRR